MDAQEEKYIKMTTPPVEKLICRLAVPCIVSMLVTAFYNMADTYFVGMLKSNAATGAVGVVFSVMAVIQAVGFFFGQGSGNFISRELGKKHYAEASQMASTGFFSALATGLIICVLGQLFLKPLALFLGSTETILPYTEAYLKIILLSLLKYIQQDIDFKQLLNRIMSYDIYTMNDAICNRQIHGTRIVDQYCCLCKEDFDVCRLFPCHPVVRDPGLCARVSMQPLLPLQLSSR